MKRLLQPQDDRFGYKQLGEKWNPIPENVNDVGEFSYPIMTFEHSNEYFNWSVNQRNYDIYCWEIEIISKIKENKDAYFDFSKDLIDIGAEYGEYGWLLPFHKAYEFEPNKEMRYAIGANLLLHRNRINNVEIMPYGISNVNETKVFNGYQLNLVDNSLLTENKFLKEAESVFRTLDSFCFDNVGFIKIDVEGHELEVLEGAVNTIIKNNYPPILIEIWPEKWRNGKSSWDTIPEGVEKRKKVIDFIKKLNYKILWCWGNPDDIETHLCIHE